MAVRGRRLLDRYSGFGRDADLSLVGSQFRAGPFVLCTGTAGAGPRSCARARASSPARRRRVRLAARCVRMESSSRRTHAGILRHEGRLSLPGIVGARRYDRTRHQLCGPHRAGRPGTSHPTLLGSALDTPLRGARTPLPDAAAALHHASPSACAGKAGGG